MVSVIVLFPGKVIAPCVVSHDTAVPVFVGVLAIVGARVTVGESVTVAEALAVGDTVGVFVLTGVLVGVAVFVGVGDGVGLGVFVGVDVSGFQLEGGAVTKIETLTITVRALSASIGSPLAFERSRKPTIFGTIGK